MPKKSLKTVQEKTKKKSPKEEEKETEEKEEEDEKEEDEKDEPSPAKVFHFEGALDDAFNSEPEELPHDVLADDEDSDVFSEEEMGAEWEE